MPGKHQQNDTGDVARKEVEQMLERMVERYVETDEVLSHATLVGRAWDMSQPDSKREFIKQTAKLMRSVLGAVPWVDAEYVADDLAYLEAEYRRLTVAQVLDACPVV